MATELVTAHSGQNHVGSDDIGALYAGALGNGRFALDVGEGMAVSMTDANTLRIGTGGFLFDGRWVRVTRAEEVKIANGTQGGFRKDLVVYIYRRSPSSGNVETGEWAVIQGIAASTEAGAVPPEVKRASILDADLEVQCPVAEVDLSGLTPTARLLLPSAASLKSVGDSVSRTVTVGNGLAGSSVWCDVANSQRVCLTARTADRARGHALVASDTSMFLYDLDAQKPVWTMRAQHPIYFSSADSTSLTVTAPHDCVIEVEAWFERQWGYNGGEATLSISTPEGLSSMCAVTGHIYGGNTTGRTLHAFGAFSGAKEGGTYTFMCSLTNSGVGISHSSMIARCFPA